MNIGINLMVFGVSFDRRNATLFRKLREMGYSGVEVPLLPPLPTQATITEVAAMIHGEGLWATASSALPADASLVAGEAEFQRAQSHFSRTLELAHILQAKTIIGPLYHPVGSFAEGSQSDLQTRAVESLSRLDTLWAPSGIQMAMEPLNRFETNLVNTFENAATMAGQVNKPWFGILADTFHAHIEEKNLSQAFTSLGNSVNHWHASENDRGAVGSGQVNWPVFAQAVQARKPIPVVVEMFGQALPELAAATRIWRNIVGDPLDSAHRSIQFLSKLFNNEGIQ